MSFLSLNRSVYYCEKNELCDNTNIWSMLGEQLRENHVEDFLYVIIEVVMRSACSPMY